MPTAAAVGSAVLGTGATLYSANKSANASKQAANAQLRAAADANAEARRQFDIGQKNLSPYIDAGKTYGLDPLGRAMGNGTLTRAFGMQDFRTDPGYQWRLQQGLDGIQSQAAARGSLMSGSTLKALMDYNQNAASAEYNNAYNRFNDNQQNQFNRLYTLAQLGQNSAAGAANNGAQFANTYGDNLTSGASAYGQGLINAASARAQGLSGLVDGVSTLAGLLGGSKIKNGFV